MINGLMPNVCLLHTCPTSQAPRRKGRRASKVPALLPGLALSTALLFRMHFRGLGVGAAVRRPHVSPPPHLLKAPFWLKTKGLESHDTALKYYDRPTGPKRLASSRLSNVHSQRLLRKRQHLPRSLRPGYAWRGGSQTLPHRSFHSSLSFDIQYPPLRAIGGSENPVPGQSGRTKFCSEIHGASEPPTFDLAARITQMGTLFLAQAATRVHVPKRGFSR